MNITTILLADDHAIVRAALRVLLQNEPDLRVIGEAATGLEAVERTRALLPDVVLMDIMMPGLNGLEATQRITSEVPATKVLILSSYTDDEYKRCSAQVGAAGYLLKQTPAADLLAAIRRARLAPPSLRVNGAVCPSLAAPPAPALRTAGGELTSRQREVIQLIARGAPNKQIAAFLGISIKTVEKHRQALMDKLHIHHTAGLTRYALARGFVTDELPAEATPGETVPGAGVNRLGCPTTPPEYALPSVGHSGV